MLQRNEAEPIWPGDVLQQYILDKLGLTQLQLAEAIKASRISVNMLVNHRRNVTADMAMRLSIATSTTIKFWLNLQRDVDLYYARRAWAARKPNIKVLRQPGALFRDIKDSGEDISGILAQAVDHD